MNLSFNLALSYRYLKDPTSRQNFEDTLGQIPKLILTLRLKTFQLVVTSIQQHKKNMKTCDCFYNP